MVRVGQEWAREIDIVILVLHKYSLVDNDLVSLILTHFSTS